MRKKIPSSSNSALVKASKQLWCFFAMRSIEKLILKLTLFLYSALNCGLSFKVSITLGNFLNCPKILKLWNLFVSSKLSKNRKVSQGGEKDSASYRLSAGCVKAKVKLRWFCATNASTKNWSNDRVAAENESADSTAFRQLLLTMAGKFNTFVQKLCYLLPSICILDKWNMIQ